ncbi:uncharacterized protein METZ01_LOCUS108416 [marine metagenome]|uniref:Uncharacterized protein n=1 Tax=marine metagenome TaxID=408172 RepID=A0A381WT76_9ZZZZ
MFASQVKQCCSFIPAFGKGRSDVDHLVEAAQCFAVVLVRHGTNAAFQPGAGLGIVYAGPAFPDLSTDPIRLLFDAGMSQLKEELIQCRIVLICRDTGPQGEAK